MKIYQNTLISSIQCGGWDSIFLWKIPRNALGHSVRIPPSLQNIANFRYLNRYLKLSMRATKVKY